MSPLFLNIGITLADFHFVGKTPVLNDRLKIRLKGLAKPKEHFFRRALLILSGPVALDASKDNNNSYTSASEILREGILG